MLMCCTERNICEPNLSLHKFAIPVTKICTKSEKKTQNENSLSEFVFYDLFAQLSSNFTDANIAKGSMHRNCIEILYGFPQLLYCKLITFPKQDMREATVLHI